MRTANADELLDTLPCGVVSFDGAVLPEFLEEVILRRLAIGSGETDVLIRRAGSGVAMNVTRRSGNLRVVMTS